MSDLHTTWSVEIETLSPLHIGSGTDLLLGYDLVSYRGRTYRVDEDVLLDSALMQAESASTEAMNRLLAGCPAAELLTKADFEPGNPLFRYVMTGTPVTSTTGARVQEQIKDVHDRLYLPGSSFKGALRTVLAWGFYAHQDRQPDLSRLKRSRSWAAQNLEQEVFGRDPNHDWLRALRVSDSHPIAADGHLALHTVRVYPTSGRGGGGLDVGVEAIERGAVFNTQVTLENYGFESDSAAELRWQGKRRWIRHLPQLGLDYTRQCLLTEANYYKDKGGPPHAMRFYDGLIKRLLELPKDTLLLQLGWGTGWESKTLGSSMLRQDSRQFEKLLRDYRVTRERGRRLGAPFPRSRKLVLVNGRPALPMGWLEVRIGGLEEIEVVEAHVERTGATPRQRTGRLLRFFPDRGYGFIKPDDEGEDVFVHVSGLADSSTSLHQGQHLAFDVEETDRGLRALNVIVIS
jgi:CRISPR-associated protein Csm5